MHNTCTELFFEFQSGQVLQNMGITVKRITERAESAEVSLCQVK